MAISEKSVYEGPCGIEPYDKEWGVGVSGMTENPSPFPRINRILNRYDKTITGPLDHERAVIVTEAYKKYHDKPHIIKCALAFAEVLKKCTIYINADELIVGSMAAPPKGAPVFPEFSYKWICDELREGTIDKCEARTHDWHTVTEETKNRLLELEDFWKGKTVEELIEQRMSEEERKGSNVEKGVFMLNNSMYCGIGHTIPNMPRLFEHGFMGLKKKIEEKLAELSPDLPENAKKRDFYQAQLIVVDAAMEYIKRFARKAREMAAQEQDETRKKELLQIADNCEWVSENPPRTFWEAIQLFNLVICMIHIESNGHSISYGRFDQWLYPYYKRDIENGTATKEFIQELIENFYIKIYELNKLRDKNSIEIFPNGGIGGPCMTVGGVDKDGKDATNDLTFMCLDAQPHVRIPTPWMAVRWHSAMPWELKVKIANIIRMGMGEPKVFNDEVCIPSKLAFGATLEEARDYALVGCVEIDIPGKEYGWHDAAYINIAKVLELAINDGRCMECGPKCMRWDVCGGVGKRLGLQTGSLADFKSFDEVLEAFDKQMKYWCDRLVTSLNIADQVHQELKPLPYLSLLIEGCIENGIDVTAGGAKYNYTGPQCVGVGTVADGLAVIKQLVFEEKKVTGAELLKAVKNNWEGYEELYALVNSDKVHHYGNDDDYADELANFALATYSKYIANRPNAHRGVFTPGAYTVGINVAYGMMMWASVDGRKAGEPVSDNLGPVHTQAGSHDVKGPTAIAKSVTKLDHTKFMNGTLLNWKFTPSSLAGEVGRDNFIHLIDTYFDRKGLHSQFNVVSRETLIDAQRNPDKYKGLLVRVAGYSAFFVELSKWLQDDIIQRTELSFD